MVMHFTTQISKTTKCYEKIFNIQVVVFWVVMSLAGGNMALWNVCTLPQYNMVSTQKSKTWIITM